MNTFDEIVDHIMRPCDTVKKRRVIELLKAFHIAVNLPRGQVPLQGEQFYSPSFSVIDLCTSINTTKKIKNKFKETK